MINLSNITTTAQSLQENITCYYLPIGYNNFSSYCQEMHFIFYTNTTAYTLAILAIAYLMHIASWFLSEHASHIEQNSSMNAEDIQDSAVVLNKTSGFIVLVYIVYALVFAYDAIFSDKRTYIYAAIILLMLYYLIVISYKVYTKRKHDHSESQ